MDDIFWKPRAPVLQNIDGYEKTRHFFKNMTFCKIGHHYPSLFPKIKILSGVVVFQKIRDPVFLKIFWGEKSKIFKILGVFHRKIHLCESASGCPKKSSFSGFHDIHPCYEKWGDFYGRFLGGGKIILSDIHVVTNTIIE